MKYLFAFLLLMFMASCAFTKQAQPIQGFKCSASVERMSIDDEKGFQIMVFPIDNGPQK